MRKPEITKKTSTPTNPPVKGPIRAWSSATSSTARARSPWMSCRKPRCTRTGYGRRAPGPKRRARRLARRLVQAYVVGVVALEQRPHPGVDVPVAAGRDVRALEVGGRDPEPLRH